MQIKLFSAILLVCLGAMAWGDEIVFANGSTVYGEVYRETDYYIYYIDPIKDCCCTTSKKEIKEVKHALEPIVDLRAFLKRTAKKISYQEKADLEAVLEAMEKFGTAKRPAGVKVVVSADPDSPELVVDPFPDEDRWPKKPAKTAPASKDKPAAPVAKEPEKAQEQPTEKQEQPAPQPNEDN